MKTNRVKGHANTTGAARGGSLRQSLQEAQERHAAGLPRQEWEERRDRAVFYRGVERAAERRIRERR